MTDLNGDGFLGNHSGGVYVLGRKPKRNYAHLKHIKRIIKSILKLFLVLALITMILAYFNVHIAVMLVQSVIGGF